MAGKFEDYLAAIMPWQAPFTAADIASGKAIGTTGSETAAGVGNWLAGENSMLGNFGRELSGENLRRAQEADRQAAIDLQRRNAEIAAEAEATNQKYLGGIADNLVAELSKMNFEAKGLDPAIAVRNPEDPRWKQSQIEALNQMSEWSKGGLTASDTATLDLANRRIAQQESAARGAQEQQMRARGFAPSGAGAYGAAQAARSAAADRMSEQGVNALAGVQQRQIGANTQRAQLGSNVRAFENAQAEDERNAKMRIAEFNTNAQNNAALTNYNRMLSGQNQAANIRTGGKAGTFVPLQPTNTNYNAVREGQANAWNAVGGLTELAGKGIGMALFPPAAPLIAAAPSIIPKQRTINYNANNAPRW